MSQYKTKLPISIIIPTKNEEHFLPRLLTSIDQQTVQPEEIIIADAQSKDKTTAIARKHPLVRLVRGGTAMFGRNNAAKKARNNILYFIDADCLLPQENYLEQTYNLFKFKKLDVASALLALDRESDKGLIRPVMFWGWRALQRTSNLVRRPLIGSLALVIVNRAAFEKIGGFADAYFEDMDLYHKAVRLGFKFAYITPPVQTSGRRFKSSWGTVRVLAALGLGGAVFALGLYHRRRIMRMLERLYGPLGGTPGKPQ